MHAHARFFWLHTASDEQKEFFVSEYSYRSDSDSFGGIRLRFAPSMHPAGWLLDYSLARGDEPDE
jgi:hypothetical protein